MGEVRELEKGVPRPFWRRKESYLRFGLLLMAVAIVAVAFLLRHKLEISEGLVERVGYPVIALSNFAASASVFVPVPGVAVACGGAFVLSPMLVAVVSAIPAALGELTGYAIGIGGHGLVERGRLYERLVEWMKRWGWLILFVLSVIPNPVFDVAGVAAGALRYPVWKFLGIVCVGKFIKFVGITYACAMGIESVLRFFNVT